MAGERGLWYDIDTFLSDILGQERNSFENDNTGVLGTNPDNTPVQTTAWSEAKGLWKDIKEYFGDAWSEISPYIVPLITGKQNYDWNKSLQDDAQSFSAYEASKQRDWQSNESQLTRDFNSAEAQKQRDHDLYMASNAYQLKAEDMRAAGLNPYLAYGTGGAEFHSGASASANAPSGAAASSSANHTNAGTGMLGNIIGTVLHSVTSSLFNNALNVSRDEQRQQYAMEQLEYKYNRMEDRDEKQMLLNVIEFMSKFGKGKKRA